MNFKLFQDVLCLGLMQVLNLQAMSNHFNASIVVLLAILTISMDALTTMPTVKNLIIAVHFCNWENPILLIISLICVIYLSHMVKALTSQEEQGPTHSLYKLLLKSSSPKPWRWQGIIMKFSLHPPLFFFLTLGALPKFDPPHWRCSSRS